MYTQYTASACTCMLYVNMIYAVLHAQCYLCPITNQAYHLHYLHRFFWARFIDYIEVFDYDDTWIISWIYWPFSFNTTHIQLDNVGLSIHINSTSCSIHRYIKCTYVKMFKIHEISWICAGLEYILVKLGESGFCSSW